MPFDLLTQLEIFPRMVPLVDILFKSVLEIFLREGQEKLSHLKSLKMHKVKAITWYCQQLRKLRILEL